MNRILLQHLVNQAECNSFHEVTLRKDIAVEIISALKTAYLHYWYTRHSIYRYTRHCIHPLLIDTHVLTLNVRAEWCKHVGTN